MIGDSLIYCCKQLEWIDVLSPTQLLTYLTLVELTDQIRFLKDFIRTETRYDEIANVIDTYDDLLEYGNKRCELNGDGILMIWLDNDTDIKGYPVVVKNNKINFGNQYPDTKYKENVKKYIVKYLYKK